METRKILLLALGIAAFIGLTSALPANAATGASLHTVDQGFNPAATAHVPSVVASAIATPGTGWFSGIAASALALEGIAACLIMRFCLSLFRPRRHAGHSACTTRTSLL